MKVPASLANAYEFACHSSACRPPTSGGTGGSSGSGKAPRDGSKASGGNGNGFGARMTKSDRAAKADDIKVLDAQVAKKQSEAQVKNGRVVLDGKAITNTIRKMGVGYNTELRGSHLPIGGRTRREVVANAVEAHVVHEHRFGQTYEKTPHQQAIQKLLNSKANPVKEAAADRALGRTPKKKGSYSEFQNS